MIVRIKHIYGWKKCTKIGTISHSFRALFFFRLSANASLISPNVHFFKRIICMTSLLLKWLSVIGVNPVQYFNWVKYFRRWHLSMPNLNLPCNVRATDGILYIHISWLKASLRRCICWSEWHRFPILRACRSVACHNHFFELSVGGSPSAHNKLHAAHSWQAALPSLGDAFLSYVFHLGLVFVLFSVQGRPDGILHGAESLRTGHDFGKLLPCESLTEESSQAGLWVC